MMSPVRIRLLDRKGLLVHDALWACAPRLFMLAKRVEASTAGALIVDRTAIYPPETRTFIRLGQAEQFRPVYYEEAR